MTTATLSRWGNSNGIVISKEICRALGIGAGSKAQVTYDAQNSTVSLQFEHSTTPYHRSRKMSMEEFAAGYTGPRVGEEWTGPDVGTEVVQ